MIFKRLLLIFAFFLLVFPLFAQEEKDASVIITVTYEHHLPVTVNFTFSRVVSLDFLALKANELIKVYNGKLEPVSFCEKNQRGVTFNVKNNIDDIGTGESIQPFIDTFYDEDKIIVKYIGYYAFIKDPLIDYQKGDFSLKSNFVAFYKREDKCFKYDITTNNQRVKLPKDGKAAQREEVVKYLGNRFISTLKFTVNGIFGSLKDKIS